MDLTLVVLFVQIVISGLVFWLVLGLARKIRATHSMASSAAQPERVQHHWPDQFRWFERVWRMISPVANRYVRPAPAIRQELLAIGIDARFDDREFSKMRLAALTTGVIVAGAISLGLLALPTAIGWELVIVLYLIGGLIGFYLPRIRLHDYYQLGRRRIIRVFSSFLDVLALTLESGLNFQSALQMAAQRLPGEGAGHSLRVQLDEVLRDIRSGEHRLAALQKFGDRLALPQVTQFVASVTAAERQGVSVSTLLRRQAEQLRISRALSAERHAMKMPVKLLAPLAICIFPCTFLVLAFPLAIRLTSSGLF